MLHTMNSGVRCCRRRGRGSFKEGIQSEVMLDSRSGLTDGHDGKHFLECNSPCTVPDVCMEKKNCHVCMDVAPLGV